MEELCGGELEEKGISGGRAATGVELGKEGGCRRHLR
jgi:hypothetical protein